MDAKLLEKYQEYAKTSEAKAVLFAKKEIKESKGFWVDIEYYEQYERSEDPLHFRVVECALYRRKLLPKYPNKSKFITNGKFDSYSYVNTVRAITWETAHRDIDMQKAQHIVGMRYVINGVRYNKNKGKYKTTPPWLNPASAFYGSSPESFRHRDRYAYELEPLWIYEVKSIEKI